MVWLSAGGIVRSILITWRALLLSPLWWFIFLRLILRFVSTKLLTFYLFFEFRLIPIVLIIIFFGAQPERLSASLYLLAYTIIFSIPFLIFVITFSPFQNLKSFSFVSISLVILIIRIRPFLVKMPVAGIHYWLPKAHVEARTSGSMILAGLLLKLGRYGVVRISSLFPKGIFLSGKIWLRLAIVRRLVTSLQSDSKKLIAYRSVTHITFILVGLITNSKLVFLRAILVSLAHGWASIAIFAIAGLLRNSRTSRLISSLKLEEKFHWILISLGVALMLNASIPPTLAFFPELLILLLLFRKRASLTLLFIFLRLLVCYYNVYFFINTLNSEESLPSQVRNSISATFVLTMLALLRRFSLLWLPII